MDIQVTALGAIIGLILSIVMIIKKYSPAYSLIFGALIGGLIGGASASDSVKLMIEGAKGITPAVLRILSAGILTGILIKSGAATKIAETIIEKLGEKKAIFALALSTLILTAVGVFIDVAVITVSPIALAIAKRLKLSKMAILLAMIGGGKSGNMMSPNPNTISGAANFQVELSSLMGANIIPAIFGLIATVFIAKSLINKGDKNIDIVTEEIHQNLPSFFTSILGPLTTIALLALRPIAGISIDPLIALPVGGLIGAISMGRAKEIKGYIEFGLSKMIGVAVLLLGTGTIAGIIANSTLKVVILSLLEKSGLPLFLLAPVSGALMSGATASTTAGTTVASATFAATLLAGGIKALNAAAMVHAGATVLDHLPHGSFFHATAGASNVNFTERMKLIPYETLVGLVITIVSTIIYGVIL